MQSLISTDKKLAVMLSAMGRGWGVIGFKNERESIQVLFITTIYKCTGRKKSGSREAHQEAVVI